MKPGPSGEDSGALPIDTNIIAAATPKRPQHEPINPKAGSSPNQSVAAHPTTGLGLQCAGGRQRSQHGHAKARQGDGAQVPRWS